MGKPDKRYEIRITDTDPALHAIVAARARANFRTVAAEAKVLLAAAVGYEPPANPLAGEVACG